MAISDNHLFLSSCHSMWPTRQVLAGFVVDSNVQRNVVLGIGGKNVGAVLDQLTHHAHFAKARCAVQRRPQIFVHLEGGCTLFRT